MIVYKITNLVNGHAYVGVTSRTIAHRFAAHKRAGQKACPALAAAIKKYGVQNFMIEPLTEVPTEAEAYSLERQLIAEHGTYARLGNGYNLTLGGEGGSAGTPKTDLAKAAMSRGRRLWMATPDGADQQAKRCALMMTAGRSPESIAKRTAAFLVTAAIPEIKALLQAGMQRATDVRLLKSATRMAAKCGAGHRIGENLYYAPDGRACCRACNLRSVKAYKQRRRQVQICDPAKSFAEVTA